MKGQAIWILLIVFVLAILGFFVYQSFKEKIEVSASAPEIPNFVDFNYYFDPSGNKKLPSEFLDIERGYFQFPLYMKNSFNEKIEVKVCPKIVLDFLESKKSIGINCLEFELSPNELKQETITIPFEGEKGDICNSTKTTLEIEITYTGVLSSLCDLYLTPGYPSCKTSKTSSVVISPTIQPNPMDVSKDKDFSVYLTINKYSDFFEIEKVNIAPIETKIIITSYGKEVVETITLDEIFSSSQPYLVEQPKDYIFIHKFNAPKIMVEEKEKKEYIEINCSAEAAQKLRICELRKENKDVENAFRKLLVKIDVSFLTKEVGNFNLFVNKEKC